MKILPKEAIPLGIMFDDAPAEFGFELVFGFPAVLALRPAKPCYCWMHDGVSASMPDRAPTRDELQGLLNDPNFVSVVFILQARVEADTFWTNMLLERGDAHGVFLAITPLPEEQYLDNPPVQRILHRLAELEDGRLSRHMADGVHTRIGVEWSQPWQIGGALASACCRSWSDVVHLHDEWIRRPPCEP